METTEWPTAESVVTFMQKYIREGIAEGDIKADGSDVDMDDVLEFADFHVFPEIPDNETKRAAFHEKAMRILGEAEAKIREWVKTLPEPTAEAEKAAEPVVSVAGVIARMGGAQAFQPEYKWDQHTIAEMLLDLDEQVFNYRGTYLITDAVATKLELFLQDFLR